ncbi:FxsA family protein [Streptomyces sp. WAC05374]|uniref:FxsA family membrane protein n=1 Tax=Streptomyces sp. WAC05374 TaxID=2487420 RepID=UPI000F86CB1E|nr:FxsA family membrane protein [Streptomyces sp. WAC05374]RST11486.1 FxsA family protein [Streptomyces sp. WAC05374]TDF43594.1 FxsA family protein [Streptomyces sp. WAC05374]TDF51708.1 FxsA family protein [Streptomyces sp. WAC05374]TDF53342.1 FxsA family protein [Streptomyces sp. WAC05374]
MTGSPPPPTRTQRSRARTLVPLGIAAWLVLEIWLLSLVAAEAGGLAVLALLVGGGVLGAAVIKRAGRRAFRTLTETLQQQEQRKEPGAAPDRASTGNGFLMLGGLLLMLPGLISDAAGLLLLLPPVRTAAARYAEKALERRIPATVRMRRPDGKVVQGEVIRHDTPPGPGAHDEPHPPLTR